MEQTLICPNCKSNISASDYFCPSCGKKLKDKQLSTTLARQLVVYLISFFLPPLGLWPAVRYLRQQDGKSKKIGIAAFVLTIISIFITVWLSRSFLDSFNKNLNKQLNLYNEIGY